MFSEALGSYAQTNFPGEIDLAAENPKPEAAVIALATFKGNDVALCVIWTPHNNHHNGILFFPGGKLKPGEDPDVAAIREMEEETSATPTRLHLVAVAPALDRGGKQKRLVAGYVCDQWKGDPIANNSEVLEARFVTRSELESWMENIDYMDVRLLIAFDKAANKFLEAQRP